MKGTLPTNRGLYRIQGKIEPKYRQQAKAAAALKGISLEEWVALAVKEKLEREAT